MKEEQETNQTLQARIAELEGSLEEVSGRAEQQQQTISFLVSEKAALTASLEHLEDADSSKYAYVLRMPPN